MKNVFLFLNLVALGLMFSCTNPVKSPQVATPSRPEWAIVVHGGAGFMNPENLTEEKQAEYNERLAAALLAGGEILENGGSGLDAVEAAIRLLEDCPLFNAGRGAVFNADGVNELDASIMDGKTLNAGAVANVTTIKNPISAARKVMDKSPHVMLIKQGAEKFAQEQGLEIVDPSWFFTQESWDALQKAKESEFKEKSGTVGCVALDKNGNIAAGTSTGGMTNKKFGRVGDSPVIGAGTYADNKTCGVSATGHGEFFIRNVVAYDISARMKYLNEPLETAANDIINNKLKAMGANGGVIAMDKNGNIAMP
ncbi:MAG: isoaspartyl peptidase/L-asparaginase, partial [Bacteroidales bacterium]|nr:isoaspartyl peptidase/L-asparaginase [Bacteroidales bacterium]